MSGKRFVSTDRFGNAYQIVGCKENKNGFAVGYCELGGKLYKVEPSMANKDGVKMWVRITKMNQQNRQTSM